jgi:hypothetical protein
MSGARQVAPRTVVGDSAPEGGGAPNFVSNQGFTCALRQAGRGVSSWSYENSWGYLVTAGRPRGPRPEVALADLCQWAQERRQAPILFGVEPADLPLLSDWQVREIGRQPIFVANHDFCPEHSGPQQPAQGREMRRQARRALSKGADWAEVTAGKVWELEQRGDLDPLLITRWQRQPLAEFSFLVALHLSAGQSHRRYFLLHDGQLPDRPLGLAILVRSERGWLVEHQILGREAPNGSGELLLCRLLGHTLRDGELLSLGITPLYRALVSDLPHREIPAILSFLPNGVRSALVAAWEPLYGFRSLQTYREKLEPSLWEPVYWATPRGLPLFVLWAVLRVFAGGSLLGHAAASAHKLLARCGRAIPLKTLRLLNAFFVASLCVWIPILWHLDGALVFGTPLAPKIWAIFDALLVLGFVRHAQELRQPRSRFRIGSFLLGLVTADAALSLIWTAMLHGTRPESPALALFLVALNAAPLLAAVFLLLCQVRRPHFLRHGGKRP